MTRRYRPSILPRDPAPGVPATYPGQCARCSGPIIRGERISFRRGHAVHCRCQSGEDES